MFGSSATARLLTLCALIALLGTPAFADSILSYNPISYWSFDETSGSQLSDLAGTQQGSYHGGYQLNTPGVWSDDSAVHFYTRAGAGYADVAHSDRYLLDSGSISFWFMDTGTIRQAGLISKDSSNFDTGGHLTMYTDSSNFNVRLQSTDDSYFVESDPIELDRWYHAVFTFGDDGMRLYMDGKLVDSNDYHGGLGTTSGGIGNYEPWVFGANSWGSQDLSVGPLQQFFSGSLDNVAVFDYPLNETQITTIHQGGVPEPASLLMLVISSASLLHRRHA